MTVDDIRNTINSVLIKYGEMPVNDFVFGDFKDSPNKRGVFQIKSAWFIYEIDEKNIKSICGPFGDEDIIYACAKLLHSSKYFKEYRFSLDAKNIYIHSHYKNLKEAKESINI